MSVSIFTKNYSVFNSIVMLIKFKMLITYIIHCCLVGYQDKDNILLKHNENVAQLKGAHEKLIEELLATNEKKSKCGLNKTSKEIYLGLTFLGICKRRNRYYGKVRSNFRNLKICNRKEIGTYLVFFLFKLGSPPPHITLFIFTVHNNKKFFPT